MPPTPTKKNVAKLRARTTSQPHPSLGQNTRLHGLFEAKSFVHFRGWEVRDNGSCNVLGWAERGRGRRDSRRCGKSPQNTMDLWSHQSNQQLRDKTGRLACAQVRSYVGPSRTRWGSLFSRGTVGITLKMAGVRVPEAQPYTRSAVAVRFGWVRVHLPPHSAPAPPPCGLVGSLCAVISGSLAHLGAPASLGCHSLGMRLS